MKTAILSFASFCCFATGSFAQVTISTNEYYNIGDMFQMVNADPLGTTAGPAGANVTWDFSTLSATTTAQTTYVTDNTSGTFVTSNIIIRLPDGTQQFVQENNTHSYLNAVVDSVSGVTINYDNYIIAQRPVTYTTAFTDTYNINIPATMLHGLGVLNTLVDGYGTLMLPNGTFTNVLRVKKMQSETDSIGSTVTTTTTTSYLWFDSLHSAPLLRIDSVVGIIGSGNTIKYLVPSVKVKNVIATSNDYNAYLRDNVLSLRGSFAANTLYDVTVYDVVGARVCSNQFIANGNPVKLEMDGRITPGMYIVKIEQRNNSIDRAVIKVMKQ